MGDDLFSTNLFWSFKKKKKKKKLGKKTLSN